jgi:hypothetical protein
MRVMQWRRGRVAKMAAAFTLGCLLLFAVVRQLGFSGADWDAHVGLGDVPDPKRLVADAVEDPFSGADGKKMRHVAHKSYPEDLPVFLGKGHLGNFEVKVPLVAVAGPGEMGAVHALKVEQKTEEEKQKGVYGFNQLVSDEISLNRTVPEMREDECQYWDYPNDMPTSSVIMVFHNEGMSTLMRTVNSIINR